MTYLKAEIRVTLLLVVLLTGASASNSFGGFELGGVFYSDLSFQHHRKAEDNLRFFGINTLELSGRNTNREYGMVSMEVDLQMLYGGNADALRKIMEEETGASVNFGNAPMMANLRELYLALYPSFADITVGRQIITFGRGVVLSPLDVFSSINLRDVNFKRSGSDVVNLRVPLGVLSGFDITAELPVGEDEHATAVKLFSTMSGFDIDLVGIHHHKSAESVMGVAFKGDMMLGVYGEFVTRFSKTFKDPSLECMIGTDYSFLRNDLVLNLEYSFNGRPLDLDTADVNSMAQIRNPFTRGSYLFFNTSYRVNELFSLSGNILCNIDDKALMGTLLGHYNILQNVNVTAYVRGFHGDFFGIALPGPDLEYSTRIEVAF